MTERQYRQKGLSCVGFGTCRPRPPFVNNKASFTLFLPKHLRSCNLNETSLAAPIFLVVLASTNLTKNL